MFGLGKDKIVHGVDAREWHVRARTDWSSPALGDDFEHDVGDGSAGSAFVWGALVIMWVVVVLGMWTRNVIIPWPLWVAFIVAVLFFPVRWFIRRPVTVVAETPGHYEYPAERWVGQVRGRARVRDELRILTRRIRTQGTPGYADSPLQPMDHTPPPDDTVVDMKKRKKPEGT